MPALCGRLLLVGWCALNAAAAVAADAKPAVPDAEFLEFLGNGDDADPELQQFLAARERTVRPEAAKQAARDGSDKP